MRRVVFAAVIGILTLEDLASAQENTMEVAKAASGAAASSQTQPAPVTEPKGRHTYDMPPVYEAKASVAPSHETERIGSYKQPRWTSFRRFANTRAYVRPAGTFAFEYWFENRTNLSDPSEVRNRSQFEFEMGLGYRLQLDVYLQTEQNGWNGSVDLKKEKVELRYALSDWGKIFLNPTLYVEYVRQKDDPVAIEAKLLLAEQIGYRWFLASNLVWERELGGNQANEYQWTTAAAYSLADSKFSLGGETKVELADVAGSRFSFGSWEFEAGPTLFWSPVQPMRILFVALLGAAHNAGKTFLQLEPTIVAGWEI